MGFQRTIKDAFDTGEHDSGARNGSSDADANSTLMNPVVVFSSDHGELFGESGLLSHFLLTHEAVSRVPLVVKGPTKIINHDNERVQQIDVVTTLLYKIGCHITSMQGINAI